MTKEEINAFTLRITQSNRTELIAVLFEIYKAYERDALEAIDKNDNEAALKALKKCVETVSHLQKDLDFQYDIAKELYALYDFVQRSLSKTIYSLRKSGIEEAAVVMDGLANAFRTIAKNDSSKPVMTNIQTVYAGMTYGRNSLTESVMEGTRPRGFYA